MFFIKNPGIILAVFSAIAFSLGDIGVRSLLGSGQGDLTVWGLVFLRGLLGLLVLSILAKKRKTKLCSPVWKKFLLIGFLGFCSTSLTFTAISLIPLYQALVILYLYPVMAMLIAFLLKMEKLDRFDPFWVVLALAGCLLLIWPEKNVAFKLELGHIAGLTGSFCYALSFILTRRLGKLQSGLEPMFFYSLCCALAALPIAYLLGTTLNINSVQLVLSGLLVGGLTSFGQLLCYLAVLWLPAHKVGVIGNLEVFVGALAGWLFFKERLSLAAIIGGLIILLSSKKISYKYSLTINLQP
jgi:drug/metabolite transporter (DMT)-like permease